MTDNLFGQYSGLARLENAQSDAPLIVAIHGGTYTSSYFDVPGYSLLDAAAERRLPVIAIDRPGYGSTPMLPAAEMTMSGQARALARDLGEAWQQYGVGRPGIVIIAHSIGAGISCLIAAGETEFPLLGIAVSGVGMRTPPEHQPMWESLPDIPLVLLPDDLKDGVMFGPEGSYGADMPAASHLANTTAPKAELVDIVSTWHHHAAETLGRISIPVHYRQAEFDHLWIVDQGEVEAFRNALSNSPRVDAALERGSGHCIDFHLAGPAFNAAQLDFVESLAAR